MINVHRHATLPLPNLMLVDTDRGVAAYTKSHTLIPDYDYITNHGGWPIDDEVGDYVCPYDDFQRLYPEYFI